MLILKRVFAVVLRFAARLIWNLKRSYSGEQSQEELNNLSIQRIRHMDEDLPDDIEDVLEVTAMLEVREYDFFDLAYRWWFGQAPNYQILERHFVRYMFNKIVPHWVRDYCRMIVDLQSQGILDKEELGISKLPDATPQSVRAGLRYFVMLLITMGLLVLIAEVAVQFWVLPCMFPPCY